MTDATARHAAAAVVVLAAGLRLTHVLTIRDYPAFEVLTLDSESYDAWARRIAAGELFRGKPFYQAPLYAYFLALIHRLTGGDLLVPRIVNAALGTIHVVLVMHLARRTLGPAVGLVAGALVALHGTLLFEEGKVMKTTLGLVLAMSTLSLLVEGRRRGRRRWFFAAGLAGGLTALVRENFLLFVAVAAAWTAWRDRARGPSLALAGGAAIAILPASIHNFVYDGEVIPVTSQLGQNFYTGVHPGNDGGGYLVPDFVRRSPRFEEVDFASEAQRRTGRAMTPGAVSRYWGREGLGHLRDDPTRGPVLLARKLGLLWHDREIPDDEDLRFFRRYAPVLRLPGPGFGLLAGLGLIGLVGAARARRPVAEVVLFVVAYSLSVVLFFVFSRYRLPLVGPLAIGAGWSLVTVWNHARRRSWRPLGVGAIAALPLAALLYRPLPGIESFANSHLTVGIALEVQGRGAEALAEYRQGLALEPDHPKLLRRTALLLADPAHRPGAGDEREFLELLARAVRVDPDHTELRFRYATALAGAGHLERAAAELEEILARGEIPPGIHANLAIAYDRLDRGAEAVRHARLALARNPDDEAMREILARR